MHNTTHAVMFHHFHGGKHLPAQGSLSSLDFLQMIDWLNKRYVILSASQYKEKFERGQLRNIDICLTFDDALKCQYDIAVPTMERLGIEAFFFVYSNAFGQNPDPLEIYRYFRTSCHADIDEFYEGFFYLVEQRSAGEYPQHWVRFNKLDYLTEYPFYSKNDRWFRYLRDEYLDGAQYDELMNELMLQKKFDQSAAKNDLWMSEEDLVDLDSRGHVIGLHSYSHPTQMSKLSRAEQELEYQQNYRHLSELIGKPVYAMSHPCGDYNKATLDILKNMNIKIGFRKDMLIKQTRSPFEIPRESHSNVFMGMHR